jgi:NADPH-dependent curcumin reductase CurA
MVMKARAIGQVIYTNSSKFQIGDYIIADGFWEKYSVLSAKKIKKVPKFIKNLPEFLALDISGLTAYFGF